MPARIIEELTSRKQEKIASFLTFESIVAVILAFMPVFIISGSWPLLIRVPVCLVAALAGYSCTLELRGLPLYEQLLWTLRGLFRLRTQGDRLLPEELPGAVPSPDQDRVIAVSGPIEVVQRRVQAGALTTLQPPSPVVSDTIPAEAEPATLAGFGQNSR